MYKKIFITHLVYTKKQYNYCYKNILLFVCRIIVNIYCFCSTTDRTTSIICIINQQVICSIACTTIKCSFSTCLICCRINIIICPYYIFQIGSTFNITYYTLSRSIFHIWYKRCSCH